MDRRLVWLVAAACGGTHKATPPPPPATATRELAPPTCADVGVILRGPMEEVEEETGRSRELAIAKVCEGTRWPASVLECIGTKPDPRGCLDQLTDAQRAEYLSLVVPPGELSHDTVHTPTCHDAIRDPEWFPPVLGDTAPERAWALGQRYQVILHECQHGWSEDHLECLRDAADASGVAACTRDHLAASEADELVAKLTAIDKLAAKIAAARQSPASLDCKRVVAAHYGDAKWKDKLDGFRPAERKKMIAASRARMLEACTKDSWDEVLRACIIADGEQTCFEAFRMSLVWGYPAAGTVSTLGIADCDAYGAAVASLMKCDKLPQESRDSMQQGFDAMKAHVASQPAKERAKLASGCRAGLDAVQQIASSVGC